MHSFMEFVLQGIFYMDLNEFSIFGRWWRWLYSPTTSLIISLVKGHIDCNGLHCGINNELLCRLQVICEIHNKDQQVNRHSNCVVIAQI